MRPIKAIVSLPIQQPARAIDSNTYQNYKRPLADVHTHTHTHILYSNNNQSAVAHCPRSPARQNKTVHEFLIKPDSAKIQLLINAKSVRNLLSIRGVAVYYTKYRRQMPRSPPYIIAMHQINQSGFDATKNTALHRVQ